MDLPDSLPILVPPYCQRSPAVLVAKARSPLIEAGVVAKGEGRHDGWCLYEGGSPNFSRSSRYTSSVGFVPSTWTINPFLRNNSNVGSVLVW